MGGVIALALAGAGARVAAADVDAGGLDALAERAGSLGAGALVARTTVDLADRAAAEALVPRVVAEFGALDVLVNLAGVGMKWLAPDRAAGTVRFWEVDLGRWERLIDVNVRAPLILAQAAARHMIPRGRGKIVNVTTSFDTMIRAASSAYGQSKAALEAASASWAGDLEGTGVTVNILVPGGATNTPFVVDDPARPRDRLIQPEVMGPPAVWLASDASDGLTSRRFVARLWDPSLPPDEAAAKASAPAAWPGFGVQSARP